MILNEKFLGFGASRMVGVLLPRNIYIHYIISLDFVKLKYIFDWL